MYIMLLNINEKKNHFFPYMNKQVFVFCMSLSNKKCTHKRTFAFSPKLDNNCSKRRVIIVIIIELPLIWVCAKYMLRFCSERKNNMIVSRVYIYQGRIKSIRKIKNSDLSMHLMQQQQQQLLLPPPTSLRFPPQQTKCSCHNTNFDRLIMLRE